MNEKTRPEPSLRGQTMNDGYYDALAEKMPELDLLFQKFSTGEIPNFLELMSALSNLVAFHTDCDTKDKLPEPPTQNMSQNKCRFCD